MKGTVISTIILSIIIVLLVINSIVLNGFSKHLLETVDKISDEPSEAIAETKKLYQHWEKWEPYISITVIHPEVETVRTAVTQMLKYAETDEKSEFILSKALFKNAITHIRFSGEVSLETIL